MSFKDKRRTDQRVPVNSEPFWITTTVISPTPPANPAGGISTTDVGYDLILASFPAKLGNFLVMDKICEVITAFDGSASIVCGTGTMATDTAGTVSVVDADHFFLSADVTEATAALYQHLDDVTITQSGTTPFAVSAATFGHLLITGADATTPVIYAVLSGSPTVGALRFHFLVARVPGSVPS
jgi:hypothetical protein